MGNILSQEEVDSLLGGISEGKIKTETDVPEKEEELDVFDFGSQSSPLHLKMPALGIINERFASFLRTSLSSATRSMVDVSISSTESVKFEEFCRSLPLPTSINIFKMAPLRGSALLVLEGPLVFAFVDTFFGGRGVSHVKVEGRSFTTIETKIIDKVVRIILTDLEQGWADVHGLKMTLTRSEMDPQFAAIVPPGESVIATKFLIELESASGLITICLPSSTLEPIKEKLARGFKNEEEAGIDESWRRYLEKKIMGIPVSISFTLGSSRIDGRKLLSLKVNDVITLDQKIGDPIVVSVEGVPKFKGYPGSLKTKKALKITERLGKE